MFPARKPSLSGFFWAFTPSFGRTICVFDSDIRKGVDVLPRCIDLLEGLD